MEKHSFLIKKARYKFILGLNFILGNNGSILITPNGVNVFKKSTFIQPKYVTHIFLYKKKTLMIEKDVDIEFFYSLSEEEKVQKSKELENKSKLKVKSDMYEVVILDDEEIDKYLEDVTNVEKQVECLEREKWPEEIRKKAEELEKLEITGNIPIRK